MTQLGGTLLVLGGLIATAWGVNRMSLYRKMAATPTSDVQDVDGPGRVELVGSAQPIDGRTIEGPLTGNEALVAGWRVEEWQKGSKNSQWVEVSEGFESVPFELEDGSGTIRVDPRSDVSSAGLGELNGTGSLPHGVDVDETVVDFQTLDLVDQLEPGDDKPDRIARFEREESTVSDQTGSVTNVFDTERKGGERLYREDRIEPGQSVYVLGTVQSQDGETFRLSDAEVVRTEDDPFVISERGESALRSEIRSGIVSLVLGIGVLAGGLFVLLN